MEHAIIIICLLGMAGVCGVLGYVCGMAEGVERGKRLGTKEGWKNEPV
jgi:hypothetical protein